MQAGERHDAATSVCLGAAGDLVTRTMVREVLEQHHAHASVVADQRSV
jgi:hypothetical protein